MLLKLGSRIYRDRRRLMFVISLAFFAGFIMYLRSDVHVYGMHVSWVIGGLYASIVGFCAMVVCVILPSMRFMMEAVAVSRLGLSLVVFFAPNFGVPILINPVLTASVVVLGGFCISRLLHGRIYKTKPTNWRDRMFPTTGTQRLPVRVEAAPWQMRFVGWIDNAVPIRA